MMRRFIIGAELECQCFDKKTEIYHFMERQPSTADCSRMPLKIRKYTGGNGQLRVTASECQTARTLKA